MDTKQWHNLARNPRYGWKSLGNGNVRSGVVRLSFVELAEPVHFKGDTSTAPRFGCTLLLPPGDNAEPFCAELKNVIADNFGGNGVSFGQPANGKIKVTHRKGTAMAKWPLFDQGEKAYDGYVSGSLALATYSSKDKRPPVVDTRMNPITDLSQVYAGGYGIVTVRPYWPKGWDNPAVGLQAVMWVADGERFGGGSLNTGEAYSDLAGIADEFAEADIAAMLA